MANEFIAEFRKAWFKRQCEERIRLMRAEAFYAKLRREVEKGLVHYHVRGDEMFASEGDK